jgi:hypothetical protein
MSEPVVLPDNFRGIISDFVNDLSMTFPEYSHLWCKWSHPEISTGELECLYEYLINIYPERFFDILYQNSDIFKSDSEINTFFLPDVDFKLLFNCEGVSHHTHTAIWKYLQLILFTITNSIKQKDMFGDTMNLFDGIDENDLQEKLTETMQSIGDFFSNIEENSTENEHDNECENDTAGDENEDAGDGEDGDGDENIFEKEMKKTAKRMFGKMPGGVKGMEKMFNFEELKKNMPNPEELHGHLKSLFDGKIGKLAKELAEELSNDLTGIMGEEGGDITSTKDILKLLMKNPKRMMDFVKKISVRLEEKMKSGDFSHDEIMKEASELFDKMKGMGGDGKELQNLMKNMMGAMGGLGGKGAKMDMNAMSNNMKKHSMREKLKERMERKRQMAATNAMFNQTIPPQTHTVTETSYANETTNKFVFSTGEKQEKSSVRDASKYKSDSTEIDDLMQKFNLTEDTGNSVSEKKNKKSKGKK